MRRLSLRARLLVGVVALAALGLLAVDSVTYHELRNFLVQRTDSSLSAAHSAVEQTLFRRQAQGSALTPDDIAALTAAAPGDFIQVRRLDGQIVASGFVPQFSSTKTVSPPLLPKTITAPAPVSGDDRASYLTVGSVQGHDRFRVRASIESSQLQPQHQGQPLQSQQPSSQSVRLVLVVATPLSGVDQTLHRLLFVEALVTLLVLAAIALLGLWVVRFSLRPLDDISKTAAAIAGGDLSRRVARADDETEVGRLGQALNAMLAQIESAFLAKDSSERRLRRFVADASHELRTPLAAVRAYAELFGRGAARRPEDLERSMQGIGRESERMSLLVDDLLLLARLDEGRPLAKESLDLEQVIQEAVDAARSIEPERTIELDSESVTVTGDRERLRQVIDNLLANVRAHTPAAAAVKVSLHRDASKAELVVSDSGPGLSAEEQELVFERFYRADPSRARASGGAGLGLSIVTAIVAAHEGEVTVRSEPGQGTRFVIELPLVPSADAGRDSEES